MRERDGDVIATQWSDALTGGTRAFGAGLPLLTPRCERASSILPSKKWLNFHHFWAILAQILPKLEKCRGASLLKPPCQNNRAD